MPSLDISIVIGCPNTCLYCARDLTEKAYRGPCLMRREDLTRWCRTLPEGCWTQFAGFAEPFANPEAADMMLDRHLEGHPVGLYTTLAGATLADIERLRAIPFIAFCVHLPDDRGFSVIPTSRDMEYLAVLLEVYEHPFPSSRFVVHAGNIRPDLSEIVPHADQQEMQTCCGYSRILPRLAPKTRFRCRTSEDRYDRNQLVPNGDVYLCSEDFALATLIGNLDRQTWAELDRGPRPPCAVCQFAEEV